MGEIAAAEKRLGRYQLIKHLASGGMADVFIANATGIEGFERYVVIKRIKAEQSKNAAFVKMFLDEARLAASLHHQHIVQVHDIGQNDGEYFFAMEYIHGEDLRGLLMKVSGKKQLIPLEHVITIMLAATAALHYAHEHRAPDRTPLNLVHRDVSPSNILVGYDGSIKVVDFGIAKAALRTDQTKSGVLKGKVAYMSPEQCRGKHLDRRSDIHALGIVLYELLTARRLFKGDSDFMTMSAIVASRIPKPSQRRPDVPPELEEIVLKALSKVPEDRYQTADEMRRALEQFAAKANLRTSTSGLSDYMLKMFGHRPEPWLVEAEDQNEELTVDFDGSASGVAAVPTDPFDSGDSSAISASPIAKARTKAASTQPPVTLNSALDQLEDHPADNSGTPVAWQTSHPAAPPRRRWVARAFAGVAVLAIGAFSVVRFTEGEDDANAQSATRTEVTAPAPTPAPVVPDPAPTQPATTEVAPAVTAEQPTVSSGSAAGSAAAATNLAKASPTVKKLPVKRAIARPVVKKQGTTTKGSADPNWDPNSLLPE
ncbi:MAG TPA: serine/threonine-protein kinase [Kofleriaceae bacterium]|nr:serine/threonine-protein kinase [Kofleriaceae bacterium]